MVITEEKMKKENFKYIKILALAFMSFVSSCATNEKIKLNSRNIASTESTDSCKKIISSLINKERVNGKKYAELGELYPKRKKLEEAYSSISDSVKDIKLHPDLPVKTTAKLVMDPHEGILAKVLLIRKAKKTIDMTYFLFDDSTSAKLLMHEIRLAVKRGVKVRIMLDPVGSISRDMMDRDLKSLIALKGREITDAAGNPTGEFAGVEVVEFNPAMNIKAHIVNWYRKIYNLIAKEQNKKQIIDFGWNHRSHDKILLIDAYSPEDSIVMLGGRNISDNYFHLFEGNEVPVTDTEFIVKGLTTDDGNGNVRNLIEEQYNRIFFYMANANLKNHFYKINRDVARDEFKKMREAARITYGEKGIIKNQLEEMLKDDYFEKDFENSIVEVVNEVQNLTRKKILSIPSRHKVINNGNSILKKIFQELHKAKTSIDIVTPYFWISDEEIEIFLKWLSEDPSRKIRIATNSIITNDLLPAQALIETSYKKLFERIKDTQFEKQIELYNFGKSDHVDFGGDIKYGFLHAKVFMFDGRQMILSTSNIDPISRHINSEVGAGLRFLDEDSKNTEKMQAFIEGVISRSIKKGSIEDEEFKNHPNGKTKWNLLRFLEVIIYKLNLHPLL